ncbi:transcriptional regulator [Streptomyces sp. NPDC002785]|uniref:transcriptional regulator n=1 Tax=Streptomyces sp. NPDC002785 TaxID=3154543 RepID=UPI00331DD6B6
MDRQRNTQLEAVMAKYGFTHQSLANEINRITAQIFGETHPRKCTDRHVRRWISGEVQWPWTRYLHALEQLFHRPAQALGFIPRGKHSANLPAPPRSPAPTKEAPVRRRRFITAPAAAAVALALNIDETPVSGRLSMTDVARARERIDRLDAHFSAIGGQPLLTVATAYLDRLSTAADHCTYGPRVEQVLHTAIASLCSSAGWAADDAGDLEAAHLWRTTALQRAILGANHRAQARAWSDLAVHARRGGHHREALRISQTALNSREARQDPRYAALLQSRLAIGHARAGDHPAAARALLAAQTAHDRINPSEPAPRWLNFLTAAEISGLEKPVGYAYGAPLPPGARWWGGLLTRVPADTLTETGTRTYALSELMVRTPWRKTGSARRLHNELLAARPEQRATLLVLQDHPKVRALYESCRHWATCARAS